MALSKTTQDHEEIKQWAEKRGGRPADVESTETANEAGIIRLEFPDAPNANDANLKEIDWEPFFQKFDKSGLAMVYQEVTAEGAESNFYKFVHPENVSESAKKSGGKKSPAKKTAPTRSTVTKKSAPPSRSVPANKSVLAKKSVPANKTVAKKAVAKTAAAKKAAPAKKTAAQGIAIKAAAKKVPAKTVAAKKTVAGKTPAKKAAGKKK